MVIYPSNVLFNNGTEPTFKTHNPLDEQYNEQKKSSQKVADFTFSFYLLKKIEL